MWTQLRERARLKRAREHLLDYTKFTFPQYKPDFAHQYVADILTNVTRGNGKRLMLFMPPQHGKSELVSIRLPTFWLGNRPNDPVILASYGTDLAISKSREARRTVESNEYSQIFKNINTSDASRTLGRWELGRGNRGFMLAVGVGGPVTGHGAMLGIIDDPFENWAAAQSETHRNHIWDWYRGTFRTRIWENGVIVIITTRWHEDDLCGRIMADQGDDWEVVRLPAIAESQEERDYNNLFLGLKEGEPDPLGRKEGEPLCPARYSSSALAELKRDVGSVVWSAEYQGVPRPSEGNRFKRHWFGTVDIAPPGAIRRVRFWDKAATEQEGNSSDPDWTVGLLMSELDGVFYIEDIVRGRWSTHERRQVMKHTAEMDFTKFGHNVTTWIEEEGGSSGKDAAHDEIKALAGFSIKTDRPTGSKQVRAEPFAAQAEAGNVKMIRAKWNHEYVDEITVFPNGKHDDQVDATSGAFNKLAWPRGWSKGIGN